MKWQIKSMVDPGDGIVSTTVIDHDTDDICGVCSMAYNGELIQDGERVDFPGWIFAVEALPPDPI